MDNKNKKLFTNSFAIKKLLKTYTNKYKPRRKQKQSGEVIKGESYKGIKITEWLMLATTIILTWGTLKLYFEAVNQSDISKRAVTVAENALRDSRNKDSLTEISDSVQLRKQDSFYRQNGQATHLVYQLDSAGMSQQLRNLNKSWKEYEIENKVYFVILGFRDTTTPAGRYNTMVEILNAGRTPALLLSMKRKNEIDSTYPLKKFMYDPIDTNSMGDILPPTGTKILTSSSIPLPPDIYKKLSDHKLFLYIHGEILYKDLISQKTKVFKYCIYYDLPTHRYQFVPPEHNGEFMK